MISTWKEIVNTAENSYVKKWKESGKAVVGYPCTFVPDEIIYAADILPYRLRGTGTTSSSIGDTYFGPVICSFPKCLLQLAGEGKFKFLDGSVIVPGCDSMRRLDECWRKAADDYKGILPGFFHYFGVPHKVTEYSLKWSYEEAKKLKQKLEEHFGITITDEALKSSIRVYNESRKLLIQLDKLRIKDDVVITGEDALAIIMASSAMPRDEYNKLLRQTISQLEAKKDKIEGRKRLMLVGSVNDDLEFMKVIEDCGAVIVADTMCFGSRSYSDLVEENGDPLFSLTKRYLNHAYCPRMFGYYKERLKYIMDRAKEAKVDGIILQNIRFCDLHGSENGIFERDLEKEGISCMRMEREYGPLTELGRVRMRIDAFLERIS
ncbi:MAG: 2-hydroxyacyl-CoA dehydratase family protein [Smithella sp.]|jgi:benzoyl-CoA reductase/2-hydroxyglutaryl-CoA dehydratase subunit BcrC/BadD/HgdB